MVSYEFFSVDETGAAHLIGMIPERRKHPERVTKESIMQRLWMLLGEGIDLNYFFVNRVNIDEETGRITRVTPFVIH